MPLISDLANTSSIVAMQKGVTSANGNGTRVDLQPYKGPVTFRYVNGGDPLSVGVSTLKLQDSADNTTFTDVTGGAFSNVSNGANASNAVAESKTYDVRDLRRYVQGPITTSGGNTAGTLIFEGQKERI